MNSRSDMDIDELCRIMCIGDQNAIYYIPEPTVPNQTECEYHLQNVLPRTKCANQQRTVQSHLRKNTTSDKKTVIIDARLRIGAEYVCPPTRTRVFWIIQNGCMHEMQQLLHTASMARPLFLSDSLNCFCRASWL